MFELIEETVRTVEESFDLRNYARTLMLPSLACAEQGRWDEAIEFGQRMLRTAQDYSDDSLISWAAWFMAIAYTYKRDLDRAIEYGEMALARAHTPGDKAMAQTFLAAAYNHAGHPDKGIALVAGVVPVYQTVRYVNMEMTSTFVLAEGYWLAGDYEKARKTAEGFLGIADRCCARVYIGHGHLILGEISLVTDPVQAASHFEKSIAVYQEIKTENFLALAYSGMGRLHKQQGNLEKAREFLTQALEIFERLGTLIEPDKVRQELAELPGPSFPRRRESRGGKAGGKATK